MRAANFGIGTGAFLAERDDWPAAIHRADQEGWRVVELTAITEALFNQLLIYLEGANTSLERFHRVSVHAPALLDSSPTLLARTLLSAPLSYDLVFHPDVYREEEQLADLGTRAVFENMDLTKPFGRAIADLSDVFRRFPSAGFCLDVAHVWTNDRTLKLGFDLLEAFGNRLRQLHVSGIEPNGEHRPMTAQDLDLYQPLLQRCAHVPWVLESVLVGRALPSGSCAPRR
jgi:hypothetical protein